MIRKNKLSIFFQQSISITSDFRKINPIIAYQVFHGAEVTLLVSRLNLLIVLNSLKKHINYQYSLLSCISGVDLLKKDYRFMISYDLLSLTLNNRIRVKLILNNYEFVHTSTTLFINADWWEREIWDLFGIFFENHPDLRRILTDYGFEGHPLRKDFPLFGFRELRYDNIKKTILSEFVVLSQEPRQFNYEMPW